MRWRGGVMVRHFAYAYFAGIRPEELLRLAPREAELVNLKTRTITVQANVSKTRHERHVAISDNLAKWLEVAPSPILPVNFRRMHAQARKHFGLNRGIDEHCPHKIAAAKRREENRRRWEAQEAKRAARQVDNVSVRNLRLAFAKGAPDVRHPYPIPSPAGTRRRGFFIEGHFPPCD